MRLIINGKSFFIQVKIEYGLFEIVIEFQLTDSVKKCVGFLLHRVLVVCGDKSAGVLHKRYSCTFLGTYT